MAGEGVVVTGAGAGRAIVMSVFSPAGEMKPEEYRRVTGVTRPGCGYGMLPAPAARAAASGAR
jgi:hypothetical protein